MKKIFLMILLSLTISGCNSTNKSEKPISIHTDDISVKEKYFQSPMQTYEENMKYKFTQSNDKDDFKEKIEYALNTLPQNNREKPDMEKIRKAIELLTEEQRINSNPYNQLILYRLKSYLFFLQGNKTSEESEKINFTELYNRLINL